MIKINICVKNVISINANNAITMKTEFKILIIIILLIIIQITLINNLYNTFKNPIIIIIILKIRKVKTM